MKKFYALYDHTAKPGNPGHGFFNTEKLVAFKTKKQRDIFVSRRDDYDFSCIAIGAKEAMKHSIKVKALEGELYPVHLPIKKLHESDSGQQTWATLESHDYIEDSEFEGAL